jgi:hypothetical protein
LCALRAREAAPSGAPDSARALDRQRFLFDLIDGSERWAGGGGGAAALAAAVELDPMGRG